MLRPVALASCLLLVAVVAGCTGSDKASDTCTGITKASLGLESASDTVVAIGTNKGCVVAELYDAKAPKTVENLLRYVSEKFYDDTCFHRVIPGFVAQGGGFDRSACGQSEKKTHEPIPLETQAHLRNEERTLAMARTQQANSATSQFYFNVATNCFLDPPTFSTCPSQSVSPDGYAVFGKVVSGWDAVKAIEQVGTKSGTPTASVYMTQVREVP